MRVQIGYTDGVKLSLEHIDARTLDLDLGRDERVVVAEAQGLRGALQSADGTTTLSDVAAERIALAALRVMLGELVLSSDTGAALTGVRASMTLDEAMTLATQADALDARDITVTIGDVHLHGAAKLTGVQLSVRGSEGRLAALRAELAGFCLRIGAVEIATPALMGDTVVIAWGGDSGFRLTADALAAPALQVSLDGVSLDTSDVTANAFALVDGRITVERAGVREGNVAIAFASSEEGDGAPSDAPAGTSPPPTDEPWVELGTLDALSGDVDVDVDVDITVPIIGSRKATHRFRVPVEQGTIDFMALERNLSTLENALLDFAVRDGDLVLERVNPLFPARGRGKPIVAWSLSPMDHELARRDLVRLAVLPEARLWNDGASNDGGEASSSPSSVALRRLALRGIAIKLALAPIDPARGKVRLRSIGSLAVRGAVHHVAGRGGAEEGELVAELEALTASVVGVPVGTSRLDVRSVVLDAAKPVVLPFADVSPTGVRLTLSGLALHGVVFA